MTPGPGVREQDVPWNLQYLKLSYILRNIDNNNDEFLGRISLVYPCHHLTNDTSHYDSRNFLSWGGFVTCIECRVLYTARGCWASIVSYMVVFYHVTITPLCYFPNIHIRKLSALVRLIRPPIFGEAVQVLISIKSPRFLNAEIRQLFSSGKSRIHLVLL